MHGKFAQYMILWLLSVMFYSYYNIFDQLIGSKLFRYNFFYTVVMQKHLSFEVLYVIKNINSTVLLFLIFSQYILFFLMKGLPDESKAKHISDFFGKSKN